MKNQPLNYKQKLLAANDYAFAFRYVKIYSMSRERNLRVARFASVGLINTAVDFGIFNVLILAAGLHNLPANIISVSVAMAVSYRLNHGFVFKTSKKKSAKNVAHFVLITAFGLYILQNIVIYIVTRDFSGLTNWLANQTESILNIDNLHKLISNNFAKGIS